MQKTGIQFVIKASFLLTPFDSIQTKLRECSEMRIKKMGPFGQHFNHAFRLVFSFFTHSVCLWGWDNGRGIPKES
jgi:hypothetical protein